MRAKKILATTLMVSLVSGCWAPIESNVHRTEVLDSSRQAERHQENDQRMEVDLEYSEKAVQVLAEDRTKCRDATTQPYVATVHTDRSFTPTGRGAQWVNGGGAAALLLVGAYAAFGPCVASNSNSGNGSTTSSGTSSSGGGTTPCSVDDANTQKTVGYVSIGLAAIPIAFFIINALRDHDSDETMPADSRHELSDWKTCAARPLADEPITIVLADGTRFTGRTKENGRALVDLSGIDTAAAVAHPQADVMVGGAVRGQADLSKLGSIAPLVAAAEAQRKAQEAAAAQAARAAQFAPADPCAAARGCTERCPESNCIQRCVQMQNACMSSGYADNVCAARGDQCTQQCSGMAARSGSGGCLQHCFQMEQACAQRGGHY